MDIFGHFRTVSRHRRLVRRYCFKVGLYRQGLCHDLSKYSPTEFLAGARYYQGTRSPNAAQREQEGYSAAWMHHKGRNRHHFEYWTDLQPGKVGYQPVAMPYGYVVESVFDRMAASRVYKGANYRAGCELEYLDRSGEAAQMHPKTLAALREHFTILRDEGEEALLAYIRKCLASL